MVEQAVLAGLEGQRGLVGPVDEVARVADVVAVILDRVLPIAGEHQRLVEPVQPAPVFLHHPPDFVAVDKFAQLAFQFGVDGHLRLSRARFRGSLSSAFQERQHVRRDQRPAFEAAAPGGDVVGEG
jgi:hypothetical protein